VLHCYSSYRVTITGGGGLALKNEMTVNTSDSVLLQVTYKLQYTPPNFLVPNVFIAFQWKKGSKILKNPPPHFFCSGIFLNLIIFEFFSETFSGQKIRGGTVFD
jgi:hypothetical protein